MHTVRKLSDLYSEKMYVKKQLTDTQPAVWGLKFSMTQKKNQKVTVGGSASFGTIASWGRKI